MNKLNLLPNFINLAGATVLLNSLLSMPAWGANLNVGDSINFDVIIRNQQVGNVNITVGEKSQNPDQGRQAIFGKFEVTKQPTLGQLVSDLNSQYNLGLDHFNWFQIAEFNPPIPNVGNPFIDPPKGGLGQQWADDKPWYYDEYTPTSVPPSKRVDPGNQLSIKGPNTSRELSYLDSPINRVVPNATFKFHTFLIGDFGNKTYDTLGGFEWSAEMQNGLTKITSLTAGATFTQDYADLIQKKFVGYTKVTKLATYSSPGSLAAGNVDSFTQLGFQAGTPFIAWTDNLPGINPQKKPNTVLGAFSPSDQLIKFNDNGGPFKKNLASGVKSTVNQDGTIRLKVTGANDLNFDGLKDTNCKTHLQQGEYNVFIKLYDTTFPNSSSSSGAPNNCPSPTPTPVPCSGASGGGGCATPSPSPISRNLLVDRDLSTDSNSNEVNRTDIIHDLLLDPELLPTDGSEDELDLADISSELLLDPELLPTDGSEDELDLADISSELLLDPKLSPTDSKNPNELKPKNLSASDSEDDAQAETAPEPTNVFGALLAVCGLGILKKLKNRKIK